MNTFLSLVRATRHTEEIEIRDNEHEDLSVMFPKETGAPTVMRLNH